MNEKKSMPEMFQEDEIDLLEIANVIIKEKKMILATFAVSVIAVVVTVLLQPKMCEVSMMVEPPFVQGVNTGTKEYADSSKNIRTRIESEAFNQDILKALKLDPQVQKIGFKTMQPEGSKLIKVSILKPVEAGETGVSLLSQLFKELSNYYNKMVEPRKDEIDRKIAGAFNNIEIKKSDTALFKKRLKLLEEKETVLTNQIKDAQLNKERFLAKGKGLLDIANQENGDEVWSCASMIHRSSIYIDQLQNKISDLKLQKEEIKSKEEKLKFEINNIKLEVEKLNSIKANIQNMRLIQNPHISQRLIKPNIKKIVAIAGVLSLMFGVFLAFAVESLRKKRCY